MGMVQLAHSQASLSAHHVAARPWVLRFALRLD
jgi:hypothetical protein